MAEAEIGWKSGATKLVKVSYVIVTRTQLHEPLPELPCVY